MCFNFIISLFLLQNLLRHEPLKLVDGGHSQRTFIYIKDAIEAVLLMIVSFDIFSPLFLFLKCTMFNCDSCDFSQENPARANGQIFNVGNPNNEVTVRQLAEMMTQVIK